MTDAAPFDGLPDDVQAFLLECFGAVVGNGALVIMALGEPYVQPTAATHVLHVRADGSYRYYGRQFEFWG